MRPPVAAALVAALAAGPALSGWLAYRFAVAELDRAMALRPPVAVIDYQPITARLAQGVAAKDLEPGFATLKGHSTRLGEHGYLVLNRASLDAVPERYLVPAQLDLPAATGRTVGQRRRRQATGTVRPWTPPRRPS